MRHEARVGRGRRLAERATRRWTLDLYDVDQQFESADVSPELQRSRH
ncbi:MAG: hypothetical protein ACK4MD_11440 [Demequina sp.]